MKNYLLALGVLCTFHQIVAQTLHVPSEYKTLDSALEQVTQDDSYTILLEEQGIYTLSKPCLYSVSIEAEVLPSVGIYYGHQVGTHSISVSDNSITVETTGAELPEFVGVDKILVHKHSGITEYDIVHVSGTTLTLSEEVTFETGEGFMVKPRVSLVLAEGLFKGATKFKGVMFEGDLRRAFDEVTLEQCVSNCRISSSVVTANQTIYLKGLEVTGTYAGHEETFLGTGLTVYANKYAQNTNSCFIGCEKAIEAGTYAHMIAKGAEFFGCITAIWADGGSQVALPGTTIRSCERGVRLSANSSCMTSDILTMTDVALGVRALFNSQFHASSLVLNNVDTHAHIDDQSLIELPSPLQAGVRTLVPEGYGSYHSGVSYNYLTSNTYTNEVMSLREEPSEVSYDTFLDSIATEELSRPYKTEKFVMPVQRRKGKSRPCKEKNCSCSCGKAPCPKKTECRCKKKCASCKPRCSSKAFFSKRCKKGCKKRGKTSCSVSCGKISTWKTKKS